MIKLGTVSLDPVQYAIAGNAVLGIKDSGKTYTSIYLAERLFDAGIPFTAFDPIGVWRYMRIPGRGKGYPIVVAHPTDGDFHLTVHNASEIVRGAMANGISLIIDLFSLELSKGDWRKIVTECVNVMLHENKQYGLRHVFIEEASEFVPQKPIDNFVFAAVEKLARMGGNSRLGYTLINQRSQEVAKSVLELCENVFLHRQRGKNALENLDKWLAIAGAKEQRDIIGNITTLPQGQCYAWIGGDDPQPPVLVKIPQKNSLHPDRRVMRGETTAGAKPAVDVDQFVSTMRAALPVIEEQRKANDPTELRKEIQRLKAQQGGNVDKTALAQEYQRGLTDGSDMAIRKITPIIQHRIGSAQQLATALAQSLTATGEEIGKLDVMQPSRPDSRPINSASVEARQWTPAEQRKFTKFKRPPIVTNGAANLPEGERKVLIAIAQHSKGVTPTQLTLFTGYKRSTRNLYLQRLTNKNYIQSDGERIMATDVGMIILGDFEPLPTGAALQDFHMQRLPDGERQILGILIRNYPRSMPRENVGEQAGYKRSTCNLYIQRLTTRELIAKDRDGVSASAELFNRT